MRYGASATPGRYSLRSFSFNLGSLGLDEWISERKIRWERRNEKLPELWGKTRQETYLEPLEILLGGRQMPRIADVVLYHLPPVFTDADHQSG